MSIADDFPSEPAPGKRWFAIVAINDPARVLETFEAPGWAPAVLIYAEKLRTGKVAEPAELREARDSEL